MQKLLTISFAIVFLTFVGKIHAQVTVTNVANINNGGQAGNVVVSGNFAYLANGNDGLRVYDITNPTSPINVGHAATFTNGNAVGVVVSSNYVYLACVSDGLRIYDVSSPANPINVGHIPCNGGNGQTVGFSTIMNTVLSGHYAFLACGYFGLQIYDISNPTNPTNVANITNNVDTNSIGFQPFTYSVALSGHFAYLANGAYGLRIYDISHLSFPTNVGQISNSVQTTFVSLTGNYAYIPGNGFLGDSMSVLDISNPSNPVIAGIVTNVYPNNITICGNYAYLADDEYGLIIYDISNPANPVKIGNDFYGESPSGARWEPFSVAISGNYAYVANAYGLAVEKLIPQSQISNAIVISWLATSTNYVLQQNSDLTTTNWLTLSNQLFITGGQGRFIVSPSTTNMFYRLLAY